MALLGVTGRFLPYRWHCSLHRDWPRTGPGLARDWPRTGPGLARDWPRTGAGLARDFEFCKSAAKSSKDCVKRDDPLLYEELRQIARRYKEGKRIQADEGDAQGIP